MVQANHIMKFEFQYAPSSLLHGLLATIVYIDSKLTVRWVTYLFVKLYEGWLEESSIILNIMVWVLGMTQTFAHFIFWLQEVSLNLTWKSMEWNNDISGVSDLLQLDVWNLFVVDIGWVVSWDKSWEFWYVGLILWLHV